jgi:hypothetical protein
MASIGHFIRDLGVEFVHIDFIWQPVFQVGKIVFGSTVCKYQLLSLIAGTLVKFTTILSMVTLPIPI